MRFTFNTILIFISLNFSFFLQFQLESIISFFFISIIFPFHNNRQRNRIIFFQTKLLICDTKHFYFLRYSIFISHFIILSFKIFIIKTVIHSMTKYHYLSEIRLMYFICLDELNNRQKNLFFSKQYDLRMELFKQFSNQIIKSYHK